MGEQGGKLEKANGLRYLATEAMAVSGLQSLPASELAASAGLVAAVLRLSLGSLAGRCRGRGWCSTAGAWRVSRA